MYTNIPKYKKGSYLGRGFTLPVRRCSAVNLLASVNVSYLSHSGPEKT